MGSALPSVDGYEACMRARIFVVRLLDQNKCAYRVFKMSLVVSSLLFNIILVEIKFINVRCNTIVFQIVEEINYMFRLFSGWVIIRLRLEYGKKNSYYNVDIKHGERDLVLQCLGRSVAIYVRAYAM
jgi:hypothetical protein